MTLVLFKWGYDNEPKVVIKFSVNNYNSWFYPKAPSLRVVNVGYHLTHKNVSLALDGLAI